MALDAANFIAELSITDPPGSDPLSQGDDQIRTIKRATFQSFPLIAAAVNITDAQMNLMAIKNEANVFTADQTIQDNAMILNAAANVGVSYQYHRSGLLRWSLSMVADAGGNDFTLTRFDDLGAFVDLPIDVNRSTGIVDFAQSPTVGGSPILIAGEIRMLVVGSTLPGGNWFTADGLNGTVDLRERFIGAIGTTFTGGAQGAFLAAKTDAGSNTGAVTLTEAQMPVHKHRILGTGAGQSQAIESTSADGLGAHGPDTTPVLTNILGGGDQAMENTGGGSSHLHSLAELNVEADGTGSQNVMPFAYFAIFIQFVP